MADTARVAPPHRVGAEQWDRLHGEAIAYRPDIDGLRAIAVAAVVIYHTWPGALRSGFAGVDVFFVISGYLITAIIARQMDDGRFSLVDFYARRVRRIFPALIVVLLATFAIGYYRSSLKDLESLGFEMVTSSIFSQNLALLSKVGYFDVAAEKKPLLHLWSLGVEEQFYILWPLTLLLLGRARNKLVAGTVAIIAVSLVLCFVLERHAQALAFYLPFTRAWELLIGALAALLRVGAPPMLPSRTGWGWVREAVAVGALAALAYGLFQTAATPPLPTAFAMVPVLATTALIGTAGSRVNRLILSVRPLVGLGAISYPLYLWHYPLIVFARSLEGPSVPGWIMVAVVLASLVLATLTYRFVETPIRFGRMPDIVRYPGLAVAMTIVASIGAYASIDKGIPRRIPTELQRFMLTGAETSVHWRRGECLLLPDQGADQFRRDCAGDPGRPVLLIWGDSYAAALSPGLREAASRSGLTLAQYNASSCAPLIGYVNAERPFCKGANDFTASQAASLKPRAAVLFGTWMVGEPDLFGGLKKSAQLLRQAGVERIVVLGPPPTWTEALPQIVVDYYLVHRRLLPERTFVRSNWALTEHMETEIRRASSEAGLEYLSGTEPFCNADGCLARIDDGQDLTAFDTGHLTLQASRVMGDYVMDYLSRPAPIAHAHE